MIDRTDNTMVKTKKEKMIDRTDNTMVKTKRRKG
jgi:hypothetical protein